MGSLRRHSVVLGGSMAGLLAARALASHFEQVTLIERDRFPELPDHRKGVPQSRHAHGLLSGGYRVLRELFPGFAADAATRGGAEADMGADIHWCIGGVRLIETRTDLRGLLLSRPALEACVRDRVLALPNVRVISEADVLGLLGDSERTYGVRYRTRSRPATEERLSADLVVDATGRGSRMPAWLKALGITPPEEERVRVDITYTTRLYHRKPHHLQGKCAAAAAVLPPNRRSGVVIAQENERWIVSLVGYLGEKPPLSHEDCIGYAEGLPAPDIHRLLRSAEPASDPITGTFPHSQRRRYENMRHFPEGLLVMGDAIASFNPAYGQGMTVAALQAQLLERTLHDGIAELAPRFFPQASALVDVPWSIAVGTDLKFPEVDGKRGAAGRLMGAYLSSVQRAGASDATVARAFLGVAQLCASPTSLFRPAIASRVLRDSFGSASRPMGEAEPSGEMRHSQSV